MNIDSIYFKGHSCFKKDWAGFDTIKPINVIIGRNNSGKSHLLDLVKALCEDKLFDNEWGYQCDGIFDEESLKEVFSENTSGGYLRGNYWSDHGVYFIDKAVTWEVTVSDGEKSARKISNIKFPDDFDLTHPYSQRYQQDPSYIKQLSDARISEIYKVLHKATHQLNGTAFRRLFADRDIKIELPNTVLTLRPDGEGATNTIRRFILTSNERFPREVIQDELLAALNSIFGSDGQFSEIQVQVHDEAQEDAIKDHWEVYLGEDTKGLWCMNRCFFGCSFE